jgi:Na+/melibiose symporter-like transporter
LRKYIGVDVLPNPLDKLRATLDQIRENEKDPEKMKRKEYIGYALGRLCYGSIAKMSSDYLNQFYLARGIRPEVSGGLLFAQKLYDSVDDPIVPLSSTAARTRRMDASSPFSPSSCPFWP